MGYSHYWYRPKVISKPKFEEIRADMASVIEFAARKGYARCGDWEGKGEPETSGTKVSFNGLGDDSCETFLVKRDISKDKYLQPSRECPGLYFGCCKTREGNYDCVVTACLIILKRHLGKSCVISSDGSNSEWNMGRTVCMECLDYGESFHFDDNELQEQFVGELTAVKGG